jgi:arylsulfatase A-like enzyme
MVDALRQDHLGLYGYKRNTSPNIDNFAQSAIVFENAITQSSWTAPAIVSLFTSKYPEEVTRSKLIKSIRGTPTFAQWLLAYNYQTAAFIANPLLIPFFGFNLGFESYNLIKWKNCSEIVDLTLEWIQSRDKQKPFYLYLHFMDVHAPYNPPPLYKKKFTTNYNGPVNGAIGDYKKLMFEKKDLHLSKEDVNQLIALYDAEIAYFDSQFERLISGLKELGVLKNSIIVITSDHGDELMDHGGLGHGHTLFDELILIPLIIRNAGIGKKIHYDGLFELIDLAPTLMGMLKIPLGHEVTGKNFTPYLEKQTPLKNIAFSEIHRTEGLRAGTWFVSARSKTDKVIYSPKQKKHTLFNLLIDPKERNPIQGKQRKKFDDLKKSIKNWRMVFGSKEHREEFPPEVKEALRSLGYVQ